LRKRKARSEKRESSESFAAGVGLGLRRAAKSARKIARMYGMPIYILVQGKIVAKKT
jgi:hypothetical protein